MQKYVPSLPVLAAMCAMATPTHGDEIRTTLADQTSVAVTIYNQNLALVKDSRAVTLPGGTNQLAFRGVSAQMRPETALLRNTSVADNLTVLEQNFDFDLLTPQKLLEKYTGKDVQIVRMNPATGKESTATAKILSTNQGTVVRIGDRIEINPSGRYVFSNVPDTLRDEPTLSILLENKSRKAQNYELSYLTGGLSWQADYVAELNSKDDGLDITGWVTLTNNSGAAYNRATMQLVAGDVNQVRPQFDRNVRRGLEEMKMSAAPQMAQESLFEYHLYTLGRPTTIADKQTKQVSLLTASNIPVKKELVLQGSNYYYGSSHGDIGQKIKLGVFVQFENREKDGLGIPLPKGVVRVYKRDSSGNAQFVGEDNIDHTPNLESVRLKLGDAFDVTANKKQTEFKVRERIVKQNVFDSSYEIEIKNGKKESVNVIIREPIPGDWTMLEESARHEKVAAGTAQWRLSIPAGSSRKLTYTARVKY
ncbi:MAG: DUF4139 domain-containing protein [Gammaproteobacteria bacterium]|nr:DUF4139 domain-containing protein [Gammaproteobacteria bacterium]